MTMCYPSDTDWLCSMSEEDLAVARSDPSSARRLERSEALAWYTLASLCAYRIGVCPTVIRPVAVRCAPGGSWLAAPVGGASYAGLPVLRIGSFTPFITGGVWVNGCGCSGSSCGCGNVDEVLLPGPVGEIVSITIDGETVSPAFYRVDNGNRLVNLDPDTKWPICQDMTAGDDEAGSFVVSYYRGAAPNELTRFAAGILANEYYKACSGKKCRLPRGVTEVARRGTTLTIAPGSFPNGETGLDEVDAVIRIYNPNKLKQSPRAISPDSGRRGGRVSTWKTA